jgi:[acyl-carrier-protein] S-malonyltransferase
MRQTAVVIAPGRGTYNKAQLGYLQRHAGHLLLSEFDTYREGQRQESVTALDNADRFAASKHTSGEHASPLIYTAGYLDFASIDREKFDIIGVTGNSMGWYTALACAGAVTPLDGFQIVNTMGTLMQRNLIGGQLIYPFFDDNWVPISGRRESILRIMAEIDGRDGHVLALSIDLGGKLVLAGNIAGLDAFEAEMPCIQDRFPMRLQNHAAFHTHLQDPVAEQGRGLLPDSLFGQPKIPMIDGRGAIWRPGAVGPIDLWSYTLGHQVVKPYDFTAAIRVAARELMPDVFIVLGPGNTLGGAVAQSLIACNWRGMHDKDSFKTQADRLLSLGA